MDIGTRMLYLVILLYTSSVHVKQSSHFYFYVVARPLVVRKYFQVYTVPLCIVVAWYE